MHSDTLSESEPTEYPPLPDGIQDSPEWQAAQVLNEHASLAEGRLALGTCMYWLSDGGYLITGLPPAGEVRGNASVMMIYTAEHLVTVRGENLAALAWAMKLQRIDNLQVTTEAGEQEGEAEWVITSITAEERGDD